MPSSDVICVVQARMGSSRRPGKVLADLKGRPMLTVLLDRLRDLSVPVVVATSDTTADDPIADLGDERGNAVVRGSETDVLARFGMALDRFEPEHVVRITADCPLTDPALVEQVLSLHRESDADYTTNVRPRTYPRGLDVEVARASALREAIERATDPLEREHVMPYLYRRPRAFRLANLRHSELLGRESWTVDTPEDLDRVRSIVTRMGRTDFTWQEAFAAVGPLAEITPGTLVLRPATAQDSDRVLEWRNDRVSVASSLSRAPVAPGVHDAWFDARLSNPGTQLLIAAVDDQPVGMVRVDVDDGVGTVSITVAPAHRGRGHATAMLAALLIQSEPDPQIVRLRALVRDDNTPSLRAFSRVGFAPIDHGRSVTTFEWTPASVETS